MIKFFKKEVNLLSKLLHEIDKDNFPNVKTAKSRIKYGWIGKMESKDGKLLNEIDLNYKPKLGDELSLYDGIFGCIERYTVVKQICCDINNQHYVY